jgi:hypothetical protein
LPSIFYSTLHSPALIATPILHIYYPSTKMFTPSTFLSLVLIAASAPALCAPVPFTPVAPRGIASALEGLVGGGVEDLIKAFLQPGNSENSKRSVGSAFEGAASHLIEPIVSGGTSFRYLHDLELTSYSRKRDWR